MNRFGEGHKAQHGGLGPLSTVASADGLRSVRRDAPALPRAAAASASPRLAAFPLKGEFYL
ncbi:MAG: hypothetical protein A4S17_00365 [Proteobacteria bacterium HN_bin10]|nr:MAG: hypothetical protein A4S17_00365 [Proteobacteria bacterium HN_bin10]